MAAGYRRSRSSTQATGSGRLLGWTHPGSGSSCGDPGEDEGRGQERCHARQCAELGSGSVVGEVDGWGTATSGTADATTRVGASLACTPRTVEVATTGAAEPTDGAPPLIAVFTANGLIAIAPAVMAAATCCMSEGMTIAHHR